MLSLWKKVEPKAAPPLYAKRRDGKSPLEIRAYSKGILGYPGGYGSCRKTNGTAVRL